MTKPGTLIGVNLRKSGLVFTLIWSGLNVYLTWTDDVHDLLDAVERVNAMPTNNTKRTKIICGALAPIYVSNNTVCLPLCSMRLRTLYRWAQQRTVRALALTDILQLTQRRIIRSSASFWRESGVFDDYFKAQTVMANRDIFEGVAE